MISENEAREFNIINRGVGTWGYGGGEHPSNFSGKVKLVGNLSLESANSAFDLFSFDRHSDNQLPNPFLHFSPAAKRTLAGYRLIQNYLKSTR